jgi:hypothetical protein
LESFIHLGLGLWQAEQKAQEESERLRQQEREQLAEKRKNDLVEFIPTLTQSIFRAIPSVL